MEEKNEKISFKEFKYWLIGLVRGKGGKLPDIEDWEQIKKMLDKVETDEERKVTIPYYVIMDTPKLKYPDIVYYADTTNTAGVNNIKYGLNNNCYNFTEEMHITSKIEEMPTGIVTTKTETVS